MKDCSAWLVLLLSLNIICFSAIAQKPEDFKIIDIGNKHAISAIEISPDKKTMAIGTAGGGIFFWNIESQKVVRKIETEGFPWGPYMYYSDDGKYLLLIQQFFTDWSLNKDRPSRAEVMDVASGNILLSKDGVHSACFTADSHSLVGLKGDEVIFWNIQTGEEEKKFKPENPTNSIAINRDVLVVSQKPTLDDLKNIPSIREDKKAIKEALKYREVAVFYDAKTLAKKFVANDIFDIVFSMHFSRDGNTLYLFNAPNTHLRSNQGAERNGYIQSADAADGSVSRIIFPTSAAEPQYKESPDRKYFTSTSIESRFRILNSVNVFDRETGATTKNFINDFRWTEDVHTGRASFEYFPDNETLLLGYGSKLAVWKLQ
jgi:WD40 repeat protein